MKLSEIKYEKAEVDYVNTSANKTRECNLCEHFIKPEACLLVGGKISPKGWCKEFEGGSAKEEQAEKKIDDDQERPIIGIFKRDKDGYFIEPDTITPKIAQIIAHNTERMVKHFEFADEFAGDQNTFDEAGNTTCEGVKTCNQLNNGKYCLLLDDDDNDVSPANIGSCRNYENKRKGDPELPFGEHGISKAAANFAWSAKGGFSCWRCPAWKNAKNRDDFGRDHWCGVGAIYTTWNGCCELNECPTVDKKGKIVVEY